MPITTHLRATALALLTIPAAASAGTYNWAAASGLLPDQVDTRMALNNTTPGAGPVLAGGLLTLQTAADADFMFYLHNGAALDMPAQLQIDTRLRLGAGSSSNNGVNAPRTHASVVFLTATGVGNALFFGNDRIFLLAGPDSLGPSALLDTDDEFHDWRITVGSGTGAAINVFRDGALVLAGSTFTGGIFAGVDTRVAFGESTLAAHGRSDWASFSHNASAVPEPASALLAMLGLGLVALQRRQPA